MLPTTIRIRVKNILNRIEGNQLVELEEMIFLTKLSSVSTVASNWVASSLGPETSSIDNY